LDPELAARLLRRLAADTVVRARTVNRVGPLETLTPRELEVLGLMKLGRTNRQIAQDLVMVRALELGILDLT
jgi:DNA-binding NarL/FixJ family response regulator